ncbi:hypothetical protein RHECNPAF_2190069 [Rhizobium etli CNPAF512]|nr:hypothetical protein RHECNPAF_2190069 [Rhizobium etli CNPAF512]
MRPRVLCCWHPLIVSCTLGPNGDRSLNSYCFRRNLPAAPPVHPATRRPIEFKAHQYFGPIACLQTNLTQGTEFLTSGQTSRAKR